MRVNDSRTKSSAEYGAPGTIPLKLLLQLDAAETKPHLGANDKHEHQVCLLIGSQPGEVASDTRMEYSVEGLGDIYTEGAVSSH